MKGKRPEIPSWPMNEQLKKHFALIRKCWSQDPTLRLSFSTLLKEVSHFCVLVSRLIVFPHFLHSATVGLS